MLKTLPATKLAPTKSHDLLELHSGNTFPTLKQQQSQWGDPLKYSGNALDIASSSIFAREDDMFKLSVMDNIEMNCPVPTLNMPVTSFHDLWNCSSPDSQYKSLEKKKKTRLKLHHLIKAPRWNGKLVCLKKNYFHKTKNWNTGMFVLL